MSKIALVTGITGQDGSYLAELLLEKVGCIGEILVTCKIVLICCYISVTRSGKGFRGDDGPPSQGARGSTRSLHRPTSSEENDRFKNTFCNLILNFSLARTFLCFL